MRFQREVKFLQNYRVVCGNQKGTFLFLYESQRLFFITVCQIMLWVCEVLWVAFAVCVLLFCVLYPLLVGFCSKTLWITSVSPSFNMSFCRIITRLFPQLCQTHFKDVMKLFFKTKKKVNFTKLSVTFIFGWSCNSISWINTLVICSHLKLAAKWYQDIFFWDQYSKTILDYSN